MAVLATGLFALGAHAQEAAPQPRAALRLRYGPAHHSGQQAAGATGQLTYGESVFDDVGVSGAFFSDAGLGGVFNVQHERLSFSPTESTALDASLLRFELGLAARIALGPLLLEPSFGYGLAQLPSVAEVPEPRLLRAVRRSVVVGGRLQLPLPARLGAELRVQAPLPIYAIDGQGRRMTSSGVEVGAALGWELSRSSSLGSSLLLDYQYWYDRYTVDATRGAYQRISRLGLALEFRLWPK